MIQYYKITITTKGYYFMPKVDLTVTISVILGCAAIISPILTSMINNLHNSKIKQLELEQEHIKNTILHQKNIFEKYIRYAGRYIALADQESSKEYEEYYFLSILYASEELRKKMISTHKNIEEGDWENATIHLEQLIPEIIDLLGKRFPKYL
jgi:hypothetical protein